MSKKAVFWIGAIVGALVAACCFDEEMEGMVTAREAGERAFREWPKGYKAACDFLLKKGEANANE